MFIVAFTNFFDNDLKIKIVKAKDWKAAIKDAFNLEFESDDLETAKEDAFNQDVLFEVKEVKINDFKIKEKQ